MNDVINAIYTRRSVRKFTDKAIPRDVLTQIADCARYAPSACNFQTWHFTVVQRPDAIESLAKALRTALNRDEGYNFYKPNALILCSNERSSKFSVEDCACAMQNIMLSARSLGVGSVWINQFKGVCDLPEVRAALDAISFPKDHLIWGTAALGYPADSNPFYRGEKKSGNISYVI